MYTASQAQSRDVVVINDTFFHVRISLGSKEILSYNNRYSAPLAVPGCDMLKLNCENDFLQPEMRALLKECYRGK